MQAFKQANPQAAGRIIHCGIGDVTEPLPQAVIERAREILRNLEGGELDERGRPRLASGGDEDAESGEGSSQLALFAPSALRPEESEALEALRAVDPLRTTPMQALELLARLAEGLRGRS